MTTQKAFDETNTGIIGPNDFKQKDSHPDQRGRVNVGGLWYWLSGWDKSKNGRNFTSLAFTLMTQDEVDTMMKKRAEKAAPQQGAMQMQQQQAQAKQQQPSAQNSNRQLDEQRYSAQNPDGSPHSSASAPQDFDDDIPF